MERTNENNQKQMDTHLGMSLSSLSLFNHSTHFAHLYKKTEKLATAIYMITNFIKDNEPLKWKFRDHALKLVSLTSAFTSVDLAHRKDLLKQYQATALEIVSFASLAQNSSLVSEMNASILIREFNALIAHIEKDENKKSNDETVVLDSAFFQVKEETPRTNVLYKEESSIVSTISQNPSFNQSKQGIPATHIQVTETKSQYLPDIKDISQTHHVSVPAQVSQPAREKVIKTEGSKDDRQTLIIKALTKRSGLNIKDFIDVIKGVSSKTIQRELLAMVSAGILKKEGERRWSTYSLAK